MTKLYYGHVINEGVKIHYYRTSEGKPPLVMLHGLTDNGLCWNRLAMALEESYDLVLVDLRAHGLSEAPEEGYEAEVQAGDAARIIRELGLVKPTVIGHSIGAHIAAILAAQQPELVGKLILEDPPWSNFHRDETPEQAAERAERLRLLIHSWRNNTLEGIMAEARAEHPLWAEAEFFQFAKAKQQVQPLAVKVITARRLPWRQVAPKVKCPVLLFTGDTGARAIMSPEDAKEALNHWRKGRMAHIPGAGHNIRRDRFEPYLAAVKEFLSRK